MKLAIIPGIFFPSPGGAQVQVHNICNKLTDLNLDVDCYIYNKTGISNNKYEIKLISKFLTSLVFFFEYYLNINLKFILKIYLKKIIKKNKYKIFHFIFLNYKSLIIIDCLKEINQKVIVTFQGADIQIDKNINYGFRLDKKYDVYLKKIINKIDHFFYISKTVKEDLVNLKIEENKMSFSPNSVEIQKFKKITKKKITKKKINFITVARYAPQKKGYDILINISEKLLKRNIEFEWKIIGKDTSNLSKVDIIKNNQSHFKIIENIENNDETYFPHSDLITHYVNSDLYINLSRIESFGITFIEALASNIPIITFNTKGVNEIVKNNINGFILDNEDQLLEKIIDVYNNRELLNDMENNLLETAKIYDLNLATKKIIDSYNNIYNKI